MTNKINYLTIHASLSDWAGQTPEAVAIVAPGRTPLTYSMLWNQIKRSVCSLREMGIEQGDRVAIVLPQGPELAVAVMTVATCAVAVPLNAGAERELFCFILKELTPKALIVLAGSDGFAISIALENNILIVEVAIKTDKAAGYFELLGERICDVTSDLLSGPDDMALVLSTSGTTSNPKFVPLTHRNICAAADNTRTALSLDSKDRCLIAATLFHAHGLVAGMMSSLIAGASVICPVTFNAENIFNCLDEFSPTWYTAVPTVHQVILQEASQHPDVISRQQLRFIRSASAFLPNAVRSELEKVFSTIVSESYGLSEAMQLTNTPLDRQTRKIGSLGIAGTSEVAIMDERGRLLGPDESGEIVARGPVVMTGYLNFPNIDAEVFLNGWLRTGDIGYIDADGHLYMTGRLKDLINRGGEKISPQEIDNVLLKHPAVSQAMAFGIPHSSLGEDVAAAVVLHHGFTATSDEIRKYVQKHLQDFKVPRIVFIISKMPTTSTGKLLRRELVERLSMMDERPSYIPPTNALEQRLVEIWQQILGVEKVGIDDNFFDLGGHSLLAVRLFSRISEDLAGDLLLEGAGNSRKKNLSPSLLWEATTIRQIAQYLRKTENSNSSDRPLMEINRGSDRIPFIMLTGDWGGMGFYVRKLARQLDAKQPVYALMPHDINAEGSPQTIEAMAASHLQTLRVTQRNGPYLLGGYSHGGLVAFEMARQIQDMGEQVLLLFTIDTTIPHPRLCYLKNIIRFLANAFGWESQTEVDVFLVWKYRLSHAQELWKEGVLRFIVYYLRRFIFRQSAEVGESFPGEEGVIDHQETGYLRAIRQYVPSFYTGKVTVVSSIEGAALRTGDPTLGWSKVSKDVHVLSVPGNHVTALTEHIDVIAAHLRTCLNDATLRQKKR